MGPKLHAPRASLQELTSFTVMPEITSRLLSALSDRYAIEHEIGVGGMVTVYLAEDLKHHRKVAVKVLRPELTAVLGDKAKRVSESLMA